MGNKIKNWLDKLYYKIGRQQTDYKVCGLKKVNDEVISTKWKKYSEAVMPVDFDESWRLNWINQRTLLNNEIVLDLEERESLGEVKFKLQGMFLNFDVYTANRGYHIHLFFKSDVLDKQRVSFCKYFNADEQIIQNHMIALENVKHWKSGGLKCLN